MSAVIQSLRPRVQEYEYPGDRRMLQRLAELTHLKALTRRFIEEHEEPWRTGDLMGNAVKVSRRQFGAAYAIAEEVARFLEVPMPLIFIRQDPTNFTYTHGAGNQVFLVIAHSLFEQLEEGGLRFIFGHEMGHIKSEHVLYTSVAHWLKDEASARERRQYIGLLPNMLEWQREAEITADRAGLLACGSVETACRTLLTLAIGSRRLAEQMDIADYVESQLLALEYNPLGLASQRTQGHPFMPLRIRHLLEFAASQQGRSLLERLGGEEPPPISLELLPRSEEPLEIELR